MKGIESAAVFQKTRNSNSAFVPAHIVWPTPVRHTPGVYFCMIRANRWTLQHRTQRHGLGEPRQWKRRERQCLYLVLACIGPRQWNRRERQRLSHSPAVLNRVVSGRQSGPVPTLHGIKKMMQPCLTYLHRISLVAAQNEPAR